MKIYINGWVELDDYPSCAGVDAGKNCKGINCCRCPSYIKYKLEQSAKEKRGSNINNE
jgi:hypothetical protein